MLTVVGDITNTVVLSFSHLVFQVNVLGDFMKMTSIV